MRCPVQMKLGDRRVTLATRNAIRADGAFGYCFFGFQSRAICWAFAS